MQISGYNNENANIVIEWISICFLAKIKRENRSEMPLNNLKKTLQFTTTPANETNVNSQQPKHFNPPPHNLDSVVDSHVFGFFAFKARNNCLNKPNWVPHWFRDHRASQLAR